MFSRIHHASTRAGWRAALLVVGLATRAAYGESELQVDLAFTTDPRLSDCPSEATFRSMVAEQVGYEPFRAGARHRVVGHARADGDDAVGAVYWQLESAAVGERELRGRTCHDVARAMAFAVAIQLQLYSDQHRDQRSDGALELDPASRDASKVASEAPPKHEPAQRTEKDPSANRLPARPPHRDSMNPPRGGATPRATGTGSWLMTTGVGAGVRLRSDPATTLEGRIVGGVSHDVVSGELALGGSLPGTWGAQAGPGFDHWSWWGSLATCLVPRPLAGCLTGRLERLTARGTGVDVSRRVSAWLVEVGPRVAIHADVSPRWRATLYIEARAVLSPARVLLDDTQVWKSPPWSLMVGADMATVWNASR